MKSAAYATGAAFSTHVDGVEEDLRSKTVGLGLWFICRQDVTCHKGPTNRVIIMNYRN